MDYWRQAYIDSIIKAAQSSLTNFVGEITITSSEIQQASQSYNYIKEVLKNKSSNNLIPKLSSEDPFLIGSYKRQTKIRPLDDIDIFVILDGSDTSFSSITGTLTAVNVNAPIYPYTLPESFTVSSTRVLNFIKNALKETYTSDIVRNQQAVSVYLSSYGITVDIVPAFKIKDSENYIIPKGSGGEEWKYSNPTKDIVLLSNLQNFHNNLVKPTIKIVKYWNREKNRNKIRSYHIEAIAYHIFTDTISPVTSLQTACQTYFSRMNNYLYACPDPTGQSEPISGYLSTDYGEMVNLYARIAKANNEISMGTQNFITYLKS